MQNKPQYCNLTTNLGAFPLFLVLEDCFYYINLHVITYWKSYLIVFHFVNCTFVHVKNIKYFQFNIHTVLKKDKMLMYFHNSKLQRNKHTSKLKLTSSTEFFLHPLIHVCKSYDSRRGFIPVCNTDY